VVLAKFEEWAPENLWIKERRHTNGLRQFYEALSAMIEGDAAIKQDEEEKQQVVVRQVEIETASADAGHAEFLEEEKLRAEKRREAEEVSQRVAANPDALFGG
jgi:multidrug efflux pump subunit AcrA (membrane-fusion protein)